MLDGMETMRGRVVRSGKDVHQVLIGACWAVHEPAMVDRAPCGQGRPGIVPPWPTGRHAAMVDRALRRATPVALPAVCGPGARATPAQGQS
jgi:hypothetical protein